MRPSDRNGGCLPASIGCAEPTGIECSKTEKQFQQLKRQNIGYAIQYNASKNFICLFLARAQDHVQNSRFLGYSIRRTRAPTWRSGYRAQQCLPGQWGVWLLNAHHLYGKLLSSPHSMLTGSELTQISQQGHTPALGRYSALRFKNSILGVVHHTIAPS